MEACRGCGGALDEKELVVLYPEEDLLQVYKQRIADELAAKKNKKAAAKEAVSANEGPSTCRSILVTFASLHNAPAVPLPE